MKFSLTYRFVCLVLSLSILAGVTMPAGLHAAIGELCEQGDDSSMQESHAMSMAMTMADHNMDICPMPGMQMHGVSHENSTMSHHSNEADGDDATSMTSDMEIDVDMHNHTHDFGFACACSIEKAPVTTQSQALTKQKVLTIALTGEIEESNLTDTSTPDRQAHLIPASTLRPQPPIFLINESFLL